MYIEYALQLQAFTAIQYACNLIENIENIRYFQLKIN